MADITALNFKPPQFPEPAQLRVHYDRKLDTLVVNLAQPKPAVSWPLDGVWVRVSCPEGDTAEIVGFEIEGFRHSFLPQHPEIAAAWRGNANRRHILLPLPRQRTARAREPFLRALGAWLMRQLPQRGQTQPVGA